MLDTTKYLLKILEEKEINEIMNTNGIILDTTQTRRISELLAMSNTHIFKGHVKIFELCSTSFSEQNYIQYERRTNELFTSNFRILLDKCEKITLYVSHAEWYDMIFDFKDGLGYAILTCVPKS